MVIARIYFTDIFMAMMGNGGPEAAATVRGGPPHNQDATWHTAWGVQLLWGK